MKENKNNVNTGHHQRLRNRFINDGPDSLKEHELVELLLSYAYPRVNTNQRAHELLNKYDKGLDLLFESSVSELMDKGNLTERAAILINLVLVFNNRYNRMSINRNNLASVKRVVEFMRPYYIGKRYEIIYLLCLNNANELISIEQISEEISSNYARLDNQKIAKIALSNNSSTIILVHNHPSGRVEPSAADIETSRKVFHAMSHIRVLLIDHIIISDKDYFSFEEEGLMDKIKLDNSF